MSKASIADSIRKRRCVPLGLTAVQVCAVGLRSRTSEPDLSPIVCRVSQISLCCRVCYNLASIRVGSSAKPAIIQHVSFIFLSVSADAAWLKCAPSRGKSIGVSGSRMSFDTFFNNNLMHYVPAERRGIFGSVLYKIL